MLMSSQKYQESFKNFKDECYDAKKKQIKDNNNLLEQVNQKIEK